MKENINLIETIETKDEKDKTDIIAQLITYSVYQIDDPFKNITVNEVAKDLQIGRNAAYELFKMCCEYYKVDKTIVEQRINEIRESLKAVNMVSLVEALAYQELGEEIAAKKSLQHYANYIEKAYLSADGLVERLDLIDPSETDYWSKLLPDIKKKIELLSSKEEKSLLKGGKKDE